MRRKKENRSLNWLFGLFAVIVSLSLPLFSISQIVVSQFNFDSNPVTQATVGPDAISISASATSDVGGVGGTNGLNAGFPKADIVMVIPGSPTFDVDGIDISIDFHREESVGDFFTRGSSLRMLGGNNLGVNYRVEDGMGGYTTITSGNAYSIPNDDNFRRYRFSYTPCDGVGTLYVDNVVVWTNDGPDNRNMYWTGAGNVIIGRGMDGTGRRDTFIDNLVIGSVDCFPLSQNPIVSFEANVLSSDEVMLNWKTSEHFLADAYQINRSTDGVHWSFLQNVSAVDGTSFYTQVDSHPFKGISYYQLVPLVGNDQAQVHVRSVNISQKEIVVYPNPATHQIKVSGIERGSPSPVLYDQLGRPIFVETTDNNDGNITMQVDALPNAIYFLQVGEVTRKIVIQKN